MKTNKLKNIASLIAVAEYKSLTRAAEELGCSKAYLSQQIKKLEQHYQVQLFHRTTRQMNLTPVGKTFLDECYEAMKVVEQAELQLLETQNSPTGTISITSVGGIFGEQYVAPAIISFMQAHPDIAVNLDFSSEHRDLIATSYDFAVRMGPLEDSSLVAKHLCWYKPTLVASPAYIKTYGAPQHPSELSAHRTISGSITQWQFSRGDASAPLKREEYQYKVNSCLSSSNGHIMLAACEAGLGLARLPSIYVEPSLNAGRLVSVMDLWHQNTNPCHVVYPPGRFRLHRVKALVNWLTESIYKQTSS